MSVSSENPANQCIQSVGVDQSIIDIKETICVGLCTDSSLAMTRRDMQCCSDDDCAECPNVAAREEHPKLSDDHNTGSESFYEPLSSDLKEKSPEHGDSSEVNQSSTSVVPDIDRPQAPSPDTPNKLASKKLFMSRFEAENASRLAKTEPQAAARPAIIQWAPSKGYQHSEMHNHVKDTLNTLNKTTHVTTAVTHSVPVHCAPVMSMCTQHTHAERDRDTHIHHAERFQNDSEITLGRKYHCKEVLQDKAVDLTSARHCQDTYVKSNFTTARIRSVDQALDLSTSRRTPSPTNSCYSRASTPVSPTSMPLTPNTNVSFTEKFQALSTDEAVTSAQHQSQSGYVDLNRLKEIYTHNFNAMVKSQAHEAKWDDNIQNPNTTKIYPRAMLSNGVKAAPVTVNVQNTESGKMYQCQLCNVMFKHRHHVVRHMRSHTGEKPFQCQECGARFARKCILTNHMRVHTGEKPFICRECGDMFSRKHHLVIHVRTHTGEKPYCCGKCGAAFSRSHHLGRHMKTHEPKRGLDGTECTIDQYQCSKCPAKFAHANSLSRHVKTHNNQSFDSKFISPNSVAAGYASETATTLTQINSRPTLSSNTLTYPFPTSFGYAFPGLATASTADARDSANRVKSESQSTNHGFYSDTIPVPRTDIVIPPSSSGFKPINSVFSSLTLGHSRVVKEEISE